MSTRVRFLFLALVLLAGSFLRLHSFERFKEVGFDEKIFAQYVEYLAGHGVDSLPALIARYNAEQQMTSLALLPPTRVSFLLAAAGWHAWAGGETVEAVRMISTLAALAVLGLSAVWAWRMGGSRAACGVAALMAVAPTQIFMAHRALVDGFFGLTALLVLWCLWECLRNSRSRGWLIGYAASLGWMVAAKENAAFVYAAVLVLLVSNRWLQIGQSSRRLWLATLLGPAAGVLVLLLCAGGWQPLAAALSTNVEKSSQLAYAELTGDGPWFRYLVDLMLVCPAVLIFALGGAFAIRRDNKPGLFLLIFLGISYFLMANVPHGMNLRYANMWDFALRWLALLPLLHGSARCATARGSRLFFYSGLGLLCLFELANYLRIFVSSEMYDPVTVQLMRALEMIR